MGFADRVRAWLRGEEPGGGASATAGSGRTAARGREGSARRRGRAQHPSATFDGTDLVEFIRTRRGVEVYLEPRTRLYGVSVLLVADDGEYLRRPVPDAATAQRLCSQHGVPVYDAERTGYPRRVRDYDRGVRSRAIELGDLPPWPGSEEQDPPPPPVGGEDPASG